MPLLKHTEPIKCLDINAARDKLAVIDDFSVLTVYEIATSTVLYTERDASSVAWNTQLDDMLAFSGTGTLSIKTGEFPLHTQRPQGEVVGFSGIKIFCQHFVAVQTVEVPQSASLYRYSTHTHTHTYRHTLMHTHKHTRTHTHKYTHDQAHTHRHAQTHILKHILTNTNVGLAVVARIATVAAATIAAADADADATAAVAAAIAAAAAAI
eukprot:5250674-Pleurochrysis_carterae.AAC.1